MFFIYLIELRRILHPLAGITYRLQASDIGIFEAYDDVLSLIKYIRGTRKNIDKSLVRYLNKLKE